MFNIVPGVPAAPPASGLVASAAPQPPGLDAWEQGFAWIPERCGASYRLVPWCDEPDGAFNPGAPGAAYGRPVGLEVAERCSTMNGQVDRERIRRAAEALTPFAIARELWEGDLTTTDPFQVSGQPRTNAHLASAAADIVSAGVSVLDGFGRLEQAAMEASLGQPVMIHVPIRLLPRLADTCRHVGQTLITHAGNTLVADAGYPGTGPAGQAVDDTLWIYATAPVVVLMSSIAWIDDSSSVDHAINDRVVTGQRLIAAPFDPCVHLAAEITI